MTLSSLAEKLARELAADPEQIRLVSRSVAAALVVQLGGRLAMEEEAARAPEPAAPPDRLITPQEAAGRVGLSMRTLIKRRHRMPYQAWLVPSGTRLIRFSERRIAEYLASKTTVVPAPGQRARVRSPHLVAPRS
jgi:hypothetical protein